MDTVYNAHLTEYGVKPDIIATAPGRFHLIGEHSWFFKDKTLSMAVNFPVYVAVSKRKDQTFHFYFKQFADRKKTSLSSIKFKKEDNKWANAIKSVIYGYTSGGYSISGCDITVFSETLPSAGFGIKTAIKIALLIAFRSLFDIHCEDSKLLQIIERGNRIFLGQENYNADNFAALYSQKGCMLVTDHDKNSYENIKIPFSDNTIFLVDLKVPRVHLWKEETLFEPENALYLGDLKETTSRVFGGWQYVNDVTDIDEMLSVVSKDTKRKLLCIIREHKDVLEAITALKKNDFSRFMRAVNHSYESLRDLYNLSCPEIDWILKRVAEIEPNLEYKREPVSCGRITGKGFGMCVYTILRGQDIQKFKEKLVEYEHVFDFHPTCYEVHSVDGARIVSEQEL
ncbi:MAG: galactokinase [Treponema sp.]|nr:galactokinase [Treponema sp.]